MISKKHFSTILRFAIYMLLGAFVAVDADAEGITPIAFSSALVKMGFQDGMEIQGDGQKICLSSGRPSYDCSRSTTLGQGICLSTGRPSYDCSRNTSPATGLCLAKGHPSYKCSRHISSLEALALEIIDISWAWDMFYNSSGNPEWVCRGKSTGQFADFERCRFEPKNDDTWPE